MTRRFDPMKVNVRLGTLLLATLLLSCTSAAPSAGQSRGESGATGQAARQRTMVAALRLEPKSISLRPPYEEVSNVDHRRLFNADIANIDDQAVPRPYLVEAIPALNSDTWRVLDNGGMETTYHLRPNLTWHDGKALSADDF